MCRNHRCTKNVVYLDDALAGDLRNEDLPDTVDETLHVCGRYKFDDGVAVVARLFASPALERLNETDLKLGI